MDLHLAKITSARTVVGAGDPVGDAIEGGAEFLRSRQGDDGLWCDFRTPAGEASTWPTAYIGYALGLAGADGPALQRAGDALALRQHVDGGWGYNEHTPVDADSTSWAALFLARLGDRDDSCRRAASCLVQHQKRGGGVATYAHPGPIRRYTGMPSWVPFRGWCQPHLEVSAAAGLAFAELPLAGFSRSAGAAWRFVRSRQVADGSWRSYWWTSPHVATRLAVALAAHMRDRDAVRRAAVWTRAGQQTDGGWCAAGSETSAFATALSVSVLVRCELDRGPIAGGVAALLRLQRPDGSWPSHPILRIPVPPDRRTAGDDRWHPFEFQPGIVVDDQHRTFTTATCLVALAETMLVQEVVWKSPGS
jgi:squalene-hopene/tetraprenyl-beta-curcumene cyclase